MGGLTLTPLGLRAGTWEARITGADETAPDVQVSHAGNPVPGVSVVVEKDGSWLLRVPVPPETLSDGVQTYLVSQAGSDARLGYFAVIAGEPADEDMRAEIDLLRAELDILKKAFRRLASER